MANDIQPHQLFADKAHIYAASRPTYPSTLYQYLVSLCHDTQCAWDAACGTGQAAIDLSRFFTRVYATDISPAQIAAAPQKPNVDYSVQPAEATSFPENTFDLVCVAQALHWFDYTLFWPEVRRVLKAEGLFAAWGYAWFSISPEIDAIIQATILTAVQPYWAAQNRLLWDRYEAVSFPFRKIESPAFELLVQWNLDELFSYLHSWSAVRRCMKVQGTTFFDEAYTAVATQWGDPATKHPAHMDLYLLVGRYEK